MRDDLSALFVESGERDPLKAAQRDMKRPLPKKFYTEVGVEARGEGFGVALDGKPVHTPARAPLVAPTRALAEALAAEWRRQGDHIDPADMPMTRMVNTALDGVSREMQATAAAIATFAGSDLVCYRAGEPESLVTAQNAAWEPVLDHFRDAHGSRFLCVEGVIFVDQPAESRAAVEGLVAREAQKPDGALRLAALHVMTTISGSVLIALALIEGALGFDAAWDAAHVDEDHELRLWGDDEEASARRAARRKEMRAAYELYAALG
ncbi:ATPase [Rhodoblastus acidophilus]|uniref:ATPase n=1 Tax=Candidatus Rhodoblastus alkanivorans TaxID=2954117 RepID=A0ABS9Z5Q1_9HYPH|nr:ATP12 family protein [Candidatus Rhodoblastus alkanivorans]MCI4678395.1 ATPase [Candidatus Rhodoblastus alkanivorans]MCI4682932.1 ATPase [Candidatus Rhodoblastus alkanivorans]MDI4640242.1 ATPase [Rhodoblastus acidophilus]